MKMKLLTQAFLLTMFLLSSTELCAQTLVVWQKNGQKAYYSLDERPKTTFTATDLFISTHMLTINYPLANVLRYTYESATGIDDISDNQGLSMSEDGADLILRNVKKDATVSVYSVGGKLISQQSADGNPLMTISLRRYPSGVYVIKHDDVSYKIVKP